MNDAAKGFLIPLGLALVVALGLALVLAAAALPIRAWRRRDPTGETHHYHEGMRTVVKETRCARQPRGRAAEALSTAASAGRRASSLS